MVRFLIALAAIFLGCPVVRAATVTINGSQTNQTIEGFGVNANHRSWNGNELKPVLNSLIDQGGMTLFRVIYDNSDWETVNDNNDSNSFNWTYYNTAYSSVEFTKLWDMLAYLNQRGITDGAIINFMGYGPAWLCGSADYSKQILTPGLEDEWAEMVASGLIYARSTRGLQFRSVMPTNEPDTLREGIHMSGGSQYATALHKLAQKLDANGLSDVKFVGPDLTTGDTQYMPEMLADPLIMSKLEHFGLHSYGGNNVAGVRSFLNSSAYPNRTIWMTEFNVWCDTCDSGTRGVYDWSYCKGTANYLLNYLASGATAGLVYEGYDSYYAHHGAWGFWGLFAVDDENAAVKTYTPRKNFYTISQISKFVRPGAQMVNISGAMAPFSPLLAFKHTALGQVTVVGINTSASSATLNGSLASMPGVSSLDLYYTSASVNMVFVGSVAVNNGSFSVTIPADCVFTLTGSATSVTSTITSPVNGAKFTAPATFPIVATAQSTTGTITSADFFNGGTWLGEATVAPYTFTWSNVPAGDYFLSVVATDSSNNTGISPQVNIAVLGPVAQINVSPASTTIFTAATQQFTATSTDSLGHALDPGPTYAWAVSGGGTINSSGLFTAGASAGGPFSVTAASSGVTGTASVSVAVASGGTVGNTTDGTSVDTMWNSGAWINAARIRPTSNMTISTLFAKVGAISGKYKCAVYAGSISQPTTLLSGTTEVSNPTTGWQAFALNSVVSLTKNSYYWLAIWSDSPSATVYYSGTNGTLRWARQDYGNWPNALTTTGGNTNNYCIYATGAAAPTLSSIAVTPANPSLSVGATQQFTATGTYSDSSTQNVTSQVTWASSATTKATINSSGLATAASAGTTTISATSGSVSGSTGLTVQPAPLSITTASLANGTVGTTYSATLAATGGTTPYSWSISVGTLPAGLAINSSTGAITGMPTAAGTTNFTVQATDSGSPMLSATKNLAITIALAPPTLSSIAVTPANPSVTVGATQQFTATGTYSDSSTQNLTSQVTWASSLTSRATINSSGLATAASAGSTTISATSGSVSGSTVLTVQPAPLSITTTLLANGTVGTAYSATLAATGGTTPYSWSISVGTLPTGLVINAGTGAITSTPTASGTFNFTAQVTDSSSPTVSVTKNFAITIVTAPTSMTIWPATAPSQVDGGLDSSVELGVKFRSDVAGTITGIRFYKLSTNTGTHVGNLWSSGGTLLASATFSSESSSGWQQVIFSTPVTIAANTTYVASYHCSAGHYSSTQNYFASAGFDNAPLHALSNAAGGGNGAYRYGTGNQFPNATWNATNYWVDVVFQTITAPTLNSITVTPANPSIQVGATQQFTATGTYSDSSTQNLTGSVTWVSSLTARATINSSGLANAVSAGTTTISATLGSISGNTSLTVQALPPTLTSITVTPANPTVLVGSTQQFTATGTYSDSSTQNLTSSVTWASSLTAQATINSGGLASAVSAGTTTISATSSGVSGNTTLTVQAAPPSITTASLASGTIGTAYSGTLIGSGGTTPYTWSVSVGSLPSGLLLNTGTGAISGTPTVAGTFSFTALLTDSNTPTQTATKDLSITVAAAPTSITLWPASTVPAVVDGGADSSVELGVKFRSDVAGTIRGIRFYKASTNTGTHVGNLWSSSGTLLATATFSGESSSGWQQVIFVTPVTIAANTTYVASYHCSNGHYSSTQNYFASVGFDNAPLHALSNAAGGGNGAYRYGTGNQFPNATWNATNYWVDVVFQSAP